MNQDIQFLFLGLGNGAVYAALALAPVIVEQLALTVADTAPVLRHGTNVLQGNAAELAANPQHIENAYLGTNETHEPARVTESHA